MDQKVLKKLQQKFFYVPVAIGWLLIMLSCSLVYYVLHTQALAKVENSLLKASAKPYFETVNSDKIIYVFLDGNEVTSYSLADAFTTEEISEVEKKIVGLDKNKFNRFSTETGKKYMFEQTRVFLEEKGKNVKKFVLIDYTDTYDMLLTLGITLICVMLACMAAVVVFYYFYARKAILPVKQSFERQQELIANASHELKTPLTIVRTNLELVGSDPLATVGDNKKWLESAEYQVGRMHSLILDMLDLTKIDATALTVERDPLVINDIIEGMMLSFEATCYEKSIELTYVAKEPVKVNANKAEIEKLAGIMLDNAIKYTPDNGKIKVEIQRQRRNAVLKFYNTGEGISQENLTNIFERFFKVDASHKETSNSFGLGLSIAKSITQSMKGNITCQSEVGKYTEFVVELPLSLTERQNK
ncbi:MAG: HAMP domain-containing histidine kinase [Clostridia bacterium]|nr:HAMP domain-containing histidine kinase [Clostridia bacterium]